MKTKITQAVKKPWDCQGPQPLPLNPALTACASERMKTVRFSFLAGFAAREPEGRETKPAASKKRLRRFFDTLITAAALLAFISAVLLQSGCLSAKPKLNPEYTPVAPPSVQPLATEGVPSPSPTEEQPQNDALGRPVEGEEHYTQYLTFNDVQVYEQASDTFVDAYISNSYPKAILCAVTIRFLSSDGEEVASGNLRTTDGQYLLRLDPGDTTVYAQINTDTSLLSLDFKLEYDAQVGIRPEKS